MLAWPHSSPACGRPAPERRDPAQNVLLITIDTLRADAVGAYGNATVSTPWIDRLAAGGVRFVQAPLQKLPLNDQELDTVNKLVCVPSA